MSNQPFYKLLQKQIYDVLSHRYGNLILVAGFTLIVVSALQFGEAFFEWSKEKYVAVFVSFNDNIAGKSFQTRLCLPIPIDVVYTWVNGTDVSVQAQLRYHTQGLVENVNSTSGSHSSCHFTHCVAPPWLIVIPPLPPEVPLELLSILYPAFSHATATVQLRGDGGAGNATLVKFNNHKDVDSALKERLTIKGKNATVMQAYLTSDYTLPNSILMKDTIFMTGFPHEYSQEELILKLPETYQTAITDMELYSDKGIAVMEVLDLKMFQEMIKEGHNLTIENKKPTLTAATLVWDLSDQKFNEDVSASRFEDNEELRYSLRSIEQFAPWVRHIYLVTNGQIPYWLNLDNPRLTVVTHQEIFLNQSHLPTFSSPAIESHLHRIYRLSDKFIYMNDDVMFGKPVWPDDFYTHSRGQKVYLTWPVPDCQDGCPSSWIKDGYCDKACNNSECEWDGGDCTGGARNQVGHMAAGQTWGGHADSGALYCSSGCADNWLADRYCDQACNVLPCGFDVGDCGVSNFFRLSRIDLELDVTQYSLPKGETNAYMNLTKIIGDGSVEQATYEEKPIVRVATVAQKFKTLSVVLLEKHNKTDLHFMLKIKEKGQEDANKTFNFTVTVDTMPVSKNATKIKGAVKEKREKKENNTKLESHKEVANVTKNIIEEFDFKFDNVSEALRGPKVIDTGATSEKKQYDDLRNYVLQEDIQKKLNTAIESYVNGELTDKGLAQEQALLWKLYLAELKKEGKKPEKKKEQDMVKGQGHNVQNEANDQGQQDVKGHEDHGQLGQLDLPGRAAVKQENGNGHLSEKKDIKSAPKIVEDKNFLKDIKGFKSEKQVVENDRGKKFPPETKEKNRINLLNLHASQDLKANEDAKDGFKGRQLKSVNDNMRMKSEGFMPWEKQGIYDKLIQDVEESEERRKLYDTNNYKNRRLLDTFGDSLRHVNRLFNTEFGYKSRKVPAHMPHFMDKNVLTELHDRFPKEWDETSSHRVRHSRDMQFAFSYFYFLMHEPASKTVSDVFDEMDTDHSGILSDREIRTLATRLYDPPLDLQTLTGFENLLINCSKHLSSFYSRAGLLQASETYYVKEMPQVTKWLINACTHVTDLIVDKFPAGYKYKHETVTEDEVAFKMIKTNISHVVAQLDDIRRHPKKFVCLNDNIDHSKADQAKTVKAVLQDFYESLFPMPSGFELPREYRNRFLRLDELHEWRKYRDWLKWWTYLALGLLIMFTLASFFSDKIDALQKSFLGRRSAAGSSNHTPGGLQVV